jgi:uncharacterized protein YndB with AHSA1/START domain
MDWSQFTRKIRIKASINDVYQAWVDREKISTWFLKSAVQLNPIDGRSHVSNGDVVEWRWNNYENPAEIEILEANDQGSFKFTFGYGMTVKVAFSKENDYTIVTLTQYNIPTGEESKMNFHVGCRQAWSTWLMNLKSWLEHGILLHDSDLGLRDDLFDFVNT